MNSAKEYYKAATWVGKALVAQRESVEAWKRKEYRVAHEYRRQMFQNVDLARAYFVCARQDAKLEALDL